MRRDKTDNRKITVVLDQATAHWGDNVGQRTYLSQYFSPLFLPPQTSWLNSAETAFAIMKKRMTKHFLFVKRQIRYQD